jgi:hypothetical protein
MEREVGYKGDQTQLLSNVTKPTLRDFPTIPAKSFKKSRPFQVNIEEDSFELSGTAIQAMSREFHLINQVSLLPSRAC